MPILKSISIHTTVERSLAYILNPEKTEDLLYTNAVNCLPNARDAYLMMKTVYEHFSSHKYDEPPPKQGKGRVKAIHYIQSFDPKDKITPEQAFEIEKLFVTKAFGKNAQVAMATHLDKGHLHNHFIINGKKFYDNKKSLQEIKIVFDRVSLTYGVKPYDKANAKRTTIAYNEWQNEKHGTSWKQKIRDEIDALIIKVKNVDELLAELEMLGYTVRRGKYISVKASDQQRAVRLKTLGEDYTVEQLASRILWKDVGSGNNLLNRKSEIGGMYTAMIYGLDNAANRHPDVYKLSEQLAIINRDNIGSIGELEGRIKQIKRETEKARQSLDALAAELDNLTALADQAEEYFSLLDKTERSPADEFCLKMYKPILERSNITSRSDYEYLKSVIDDTKQKTAPLKENFEKCSRLLEVYSEIAKTYYEISQGDYINKLIEQQQQEKDAPTKRPHR